MKWKRINRTDWKKYNLSKKFIISSAYLYKFKRKNNNKVLKLIVY